MTTHPALKSMICSVMLAGLVPAFADAPKTIPVNRSVRVSDAWTRATVPGQMGSGAFMKITSQTTTTLIGISSPLAGVAEVHEMKMDGDVMKMRAVPELELPAGKTVELKSGGYHLMLMDLKQTLRAGSSMPLRLHFRDPQGSESRLDIRVPVGLNASASLQAPVDVERPRVGSGPRN